MGWAVVYGTRASSASVGRSARKEEPRVDRSLVPSGAPMISSWAITPAWVWNSRPEARSNR